MSAAISRLLQSITKVRFVLWGSLLFFVNSCSDTPTNINVGQAAPVFSTATLQGERIDFPAMLVGKPVVIRFWADWCRYCEGEMKMIEQSYQHQRQSGHAFEMLAINAGQDKASAASFARKLGLTYPVLLDETAKIAKQYGVSGLPTTYFVDAKGVIRSKLVGEASTAVFAQQLGLIVQ
jgi:peroxiredoxin